MDPIKADVAYCPMTAPDQIVLVSVNVKPRSWRICGPKTGQQLGEHVSLAATTKHARHRSQDAPGCQGIGGNADGSKAPRRRHDHAWCRLWVYVRLSTMAHRRSLEERQSMLGGKGKERRCVTVIACRAAQCVARASDLVPMLLFWVSGLLSPLWAYRGRGGI